MYEWLLSKGRWAWQDDGHSDSSCYSSCAWEYCETWVCMVNKALVMNIFLLLLIVTHPGDELSVSGDILMMKQLG